MGDCMTPLPSKILVSLPKEDPVKVPSQYIPQMLMRRHHARIVVITCARGADQHTGGHFESTGGGKVFFLRATEATHGDTTQTRVRQGGQHHEDTTWETETEETQECDMRETSRKKTEDSGGRQRETAERQRKRDKTPTRKEKTQTIKEKKTGR